jgi:hypothetical protein
MTSLTRTWTILIALTALCLGAGRAGNEGSIGLLGIGLMLLAATFKADQILTHFRGLRRAGSGWRILFRTAHPARSGDLRNLRSVAAPGNHITEVAKVVKIQRITPD